MFIELHSRSAFSFLEGSSLPEDLIATCAHLNMPAMALLDRDGVYGAPRFYMAAKTARIKAHLGAELTSENSSITFRLPLLVSCRSGYQNLCRLITKMKLRTKKGEGAVRMEELQEHGSGLICLTGGDDGPLAIALARGGMEEARRSVERLTNMFGQENVYVELQRHFHREQEARNRAAIEIARSLQLPLLATNGVCYATPRERELCDVFTAIRNHCTLATAGRLLARNSERHLKSPQQMQQLFADLPEALTNTVELSSRLEYTLENLGYEFPKYPVPEGETMMSFLRERTREGFQQRYGRSDVGLKSRAQQQVERELGLIERLNLAGYFLIVWDLVRFCREQNILVQGRGSAANSAVCYSLGITAVDPIGMELLFERFLSEERGEWPDIDLDLPSGDQRERVIQYLYKRYGERGAAMTANVITYRNRMASREMGKALGFDPETLDKVSSAVSTWEYRDSHDTLDHRFHDAGLALSHPRLRKYFELCEAVQDLPRHLGQHSGGMVICQGQLDSVVPLEPASMPGRVVAQWDKDDCADLGIIKVDLLGLGMMAVLEDSLGLIHSAKGRHHWHVPSRKPCPDVMFAAPTAATFLRHRGAGGHHSPWADCGADGESVFTAAPGTRTRDLSASFARVCAGAYYGRPAFSGTVIADGHGGRRIQRRRGGRSTPGDGIQALGKAHEGNRDQTSRWHGTQWHFTRSAGADHSFDYFFRAVRISRVPRGQLRADRLCQRLSEMPLPGGFHRCPAQ